MMISRKIIFLLAGLSLLAVSCTQHVNREEALQSLRQTDRAFSDLSVKKGVYEAFTTYAHDSVIKLQDGALPVIGKQNLESVFAKQKTQNYTLEWRCHRADVAASGELGYTFGVWKLTAVSATGEDKAFYGNYMTVWKKDDSGTWKFAVDGGNSTPEQAL
jgi:ketosteroid isomerase-like protein